MMVVLTMMVSVLWVLLVVIGRGLSGQRVVPPCASRDQLSLGHPVQQHPQARVRASPRDDDGAAPATAAHGVPAAHQSGSTSRTGQSGVGGGGEENQVCCRCVWCMWLCGLVCACVRGCVLAGGSVSDSTCLFVPNLPVCP